MSNSSRLRRFGATSLPTVIFALLLLAGMEVLGPSPAQAASKYASIVIDNNTGRVLYSRNADAHRFPASLTKIMTLYMVFERLKSGQLKLDTKLKVSKFAAGKPPSKIGLKAGQTIRVRDAIRALVTKSANDVACVVAENLGGSEAGFARMMTLKAAKIGMKRTTFRNASGLPNKTQITTARDMATLSQRIRADFPQYFGYFRTKHFKYRGKNYRNHNALLFTYKGSEGIKTGYTRASGFNLASSVKRGDKHLIAVVMGGKSSKSRNAHMRSLLDRSWRKASRHKRPAPRFKPVPVARATGVPLPLRNPLGRQPVVTAKKAAGKKVTAALAPSFQPFPDAPGIPIAHGEFTKPNYQTNDSVRETPQRSGAYHVQVGAYSSQSEAIAQLNQVQAKARQYLEGHDPITMPLPNRKRYLFRARFAGFSEDAARRTCSRLIAKKIPCIVMRAE